MLTVIVAGAGHPLRSRGHGDQHHCDTVYTEGCRTAVDASSNKAQQLYQCARALVVSFKPSLPSGLERTRRGLFFYPARISYCYLQA